MSVVLDCKQANVALLLLEHDVIGLPNLFGGGLERKPGIGEAWFCECDVCAVLVVFLASLCLGKVGGDGLATGRHGERHVDNGIF